MPNKWHVFKECKTQETKLQRRGLPVFSEFSGSFGRLPIGLILNFPGFVAEVAHTRFSALIRLFKNDKKGDSTPAFSPFSDELRSYGADKETMQSIQ
jgi:hypothetical protein